MFSSSSLLSQLYSTLASTAAILMVAMSLIHWVPNNWLHNFKLSCRGFLSRFTDPNLTIVIPEFDGLVPNEVYEAAEVYLGGKINPTTRRLRLSKPRREKSMKLTMEKDEVVIDPFESVVYNWRMECEKVEKNVGHGSSDVSLTEMEVRSFELSFPVTEKKRVFEAYLPHVMNRARAIAAQKKTLKLFTANVGCLWGSQGDAWQSVYLEHPSTFDTLALDPTLKKTILDDLDGFVKRKEFYKSVGKAWKRGYLLYGPPGTGKSSLIAAIANYLNFDIYDLDLTELNYNSELRKLMVGTANSSILVVEDIDCSVNLHNRNTSTKKSKRQVSLSGMLNFIDGLWSSCGDERIIIFTTNYKDKLDPALLRPGRMDMHIHLSHCTPAGFRVLASNYLKIENHPRFEDIEKLITEVEVTPAEVAEKLMKNAEQDVIIRELYEFLEVKKVDHREAKDRAGKEADEKKKKRRGKKGKGEKDGNKDSDDKKKDADDDDSSSSSDDDDDSSSDDDDDESSSDDEESTSTVENSGDEKLV